MSTRQKWIVIGANVVTAAVIIAVGRAWSDEMSTEGAALVRLDHNWLILISFLFCLSGWIAWRFNASFTVSTTRMLLWAVIAYLGISNAVDLLGEHYGIVREILGLSPPTAERALLIELRARLADFIVVICMAITSIAIGFEPRGES